jgi:hypothetical protein
MWTHLGISDVAVRGAVIGGRALIEGTGRCRWRPQWRLLGERRPPVIKHLASKVTLPFSDMESVSVGSSTKDVVVVVESNYDFSTIH